MVPFVSGPDINLWMICPSLNVSGVSDLDPIILLRLASVARLPSFLPSARCWEVPAGRNHYWRQRRSHLAVLMMVLSLSVNLELNPGPPCRAQGNGPNIDALGLGEVSKKGCMFFGRLNVRSLSRCVDELRELVSAASDKGCKVFLSCSESWLNEGIPDSFVSIHELRLFRRDI